MRIKIFDNIINNRVEIKFKSRKFVKKNISKNKYFFIEIINNNNINSSKKTIYDNIMSDFLKTFDNKQLSNFKKISANSIIDFVEKLHNKKIKICIFAYYKHYSFIYHNLRHLGYNVYFVDI